MDTVDLATAEQWLERLRMVRNWGAVFVVVGVAMELLGDWFARPYEKVVEHARTSEIAKANEAAAKANERAAEANKKAEEEKLARVKIEERLAPRSIDAPQT